MIPSWFSCTVPLVKPGLALEIPRDLPSGVSERETSVSGPGLALDDGVCPPNVLTVALPIPI